MSEGKLNRISASITQPRVQGASQAMLYATGLTEQDMHKAQVGIASVWYDGNPCNMHLLDLATAVKEGVVAADLVGMRFNTIGVSDGISMGTRGMSFSLQSRDLIADSIETVMGGQWYDALITIPGCDKNMPGVLMAMGRVNRPALMVYGGSIRPGHSGDKTLDIVSRFNATGNTLPTKSAMPSVRTSCGTPVLVPGPAAACIRPTPWPPPSKRWACRCRIVRRCRPLPLPSWRNAGTPGKPFAGCWSRTSNPATS